MDLRSGVSIWQGIGERPVKYPALDGDRSCDVAIVGGGITGALLAYYLTREGVDTILLDKGSPGTGSTVASTGLLQHQVDTPLCELIDKVGESGAVRSYQLGLSAIDELERIVAELDDNCGFARRSTLYLANSRWHVRRLKREYECQAEHGFEVTYLTPEDLSQNASFHAAGAIRCQGDAEIDPFRFTQQLLRHAGQRGLRAFEQSEVREFVPDAAGILLKTKSGNVKARRAAIATGYNAHEQLKQDVGSLQSTYALASSPIESFAGWPDRCLIWETARPYAYLRSTPDGRAIIGGGDTAFSTDHKRDGLVKKKVDQLTRRFEEMFPQINFEPEFAWAGTFSQTKDGLAYIGESPELPNAYFALGYGGNGITFGAIAAKIITDLYVGRSNPDAAIFRFDR